MRIKTAVIVLLLIVAPLFVSSPAVRANAAEEPLSLKTLIDEALGNNPDILAAEARWKASTFRVPQAKSLPDPMVMVGYQNEGWDRYTFGEMLGAQWMYSVSQMFPFPGKRGLKGEMAARDAESMEASYRALRLNIVAEVKRLYYDLFLAYKDLDLVRDKTALFTRIEEAALARYSSGNGPQQEVLMAQTEKYMLMERETMLEQKLQSLEAMLNAAVGRSADSPLARPPEPASTPFSLSLEELQSAASEHSPEIRERERMTASAGARIGMAEKEYFPDFTVTASVGKRSGPFEDMWSLTAAVNIPLYFRSKQRQALFEAKSLAAGADRALESGRLMVSSGLRDAYAMFKASAKLMDLYKQGLIPKTYQDFELALAGYTTGRVEAITAISRLKSLLDYETQYWAQFAEREKAIARLEALAGIGDGGAEGTEQTP